MPGSALERLSVLIVEDNQHMRSLLRSLLNSIGIREVYEAGHGTAALAVLQDKRCDLVLSDLAIHEPAAFKALVDQASKA